MQCYRRQRHGKGRPAFCHEGGETGGGGLFERRSHLGRTSPAERQPGWVGPARQCLMKPRLTRAGRRGWVGGGLTGPVTGPRSRFSLFQMVSNCLQGSGYVCERWEA
jgi:hypothetical protein